MNTSKNEIQAQKGAFFLLASILSNYPDENWLEATEGLLSDLKQSGPDLENESTWHKLLEQLEVYTLNPPLILELKSEYINIFDRGNSATPLYETEYDRARTVVKSNDLADISGFYKAFGFEFATTDSAKDMHDHVSVELEFYALLLFKCIYFIENANNEGLEIVEDGKRKFLQAHLGCFVKAITQRPGVQESKFYAAVFDWIEQLVAKECLAVGAKPVISSWVSSPQLEEALACATNL